MTTGRQLIEAALRDPMRAIGWKPRAAGWFTRELRPGAVGVLAVSAASAHARAGEATVTLHVHLRLTDVEALVSSLCDVSGSGDGYRNTTASTSIGYLMNPPRWREWAVADSRSAEIAAFEMAQAAEAYAEPYLQGLLADSSALREAVHESPRAAQARGFCAEVVCAALFGAPSDAQALIEKRLAAISTRLDPAAEGERRVARRLSHWLDPRHLEQF